MNILSFQISQNHELLLYYNFVVLALFNTTYTINMIYSTCRLRELKVGTEGDLVTGLAGLQSDLPPGVVRAPDIIRQ